MESRLPGCIGYLDGCHIDLFEAPFDHHESYFSRKQKYGIQLQAVCDNDLLFRNITVGYPASAHDARVFANSPLNMRPEQFFSTGDWIAADSAYRLTENVLTPFRDNSTYGSAAHRKAYNRHFSGSYLLCGYPQSNLILNFVGYRVKIEQAFGILKKVFGSLRSLRIRVNAEIGHRRACEWIRACCIIYNIIKPVEEVEYENSGDDQIFDGNNDIRGEEMRIDLFNWINGI